MRKVGLIRVGLIGHLEKFTMRKVGLIQKLKCQMEAFSGSNQKDYSEKFSQDCFLLMLKHIKTFVLKL